MKQIQMAYGMQIPQVSFPYFYPTKIPTSIPAPSNSNDEPKHANIIMYNSRSSGPLNFSKRDTNFNNNDELVNQKGHHRMYSPTISKYSNRDDHKTNISEQDDAAEENIEIDSI